MGERTSRQGVRRVLTLAGAASTVALWPLVLARAFGHPFPLELLTHFQLQYFFGAAACAVLLAVLRSFRWAAAAAVAAVVAGAALWPYVAAGPSGLAHASAPEAEAPAHLRIMLSNVLGTNTDHGRVLAAVVEADPDVVVLQEVTARWMEALEPLRAKYPNVCSGPREDNYLITVFSRHPLENLRVEHLGEAGEPTVAADVVLGERRLRLVATHPVPPMSRRMLALRNDQLERVARRALVEGRRPLVLIGDLNTTMWSPWAANLRRALRLTDVRAGQGVMPSWPAWLPAACRLPIDHCLVSRDLTVRSCRLGPRVGSDHLPLVVDLAVP